VLFITAPSGATGGAPAVSGPSCSSQDLDDDGLAAVRLQLRLGREDSPVPHPDYPPRSCGHPGVMGDQHDRLAAAMQLAGGGEQAQPQPFGFPGAGRAVQSEHLHPGGQLAGRGHPLAPQLVGREALQREVMQPGVLGGADAVLTPCAAAVP